MALTRPFAENGNKVTIPEITTDGSVSYDQGFGAFYALPPEEGGLFIDRAQFNQLMYDTTSQILANKTQLNSIFAGNKSPYLLQPSGISITVGTGGNFTNLNDAFSYIKQTNSKQINSISNVTLLSDFNDNLTLEAFPPCAINCNGFKLGNNLNINNSSHIIIRKLKLSGQLSLLRSSKIYLGSEATIGGGSTQNAIVDSSIYANDSSIAITGNISLNPPSGSFGLVSKGSSNIYLATPSSYTQSQGAGFVYVVGGGILNSDAGVGVNLDNVSVPKINIVANTLSLNGIVFGNIWG